MLAHVTVMRSGALYRCIFGADTSVVHRALSLRPYWDPAGSAELVRELGLDREPCKMLRQLSLLAHRGAISLHITV